MNPGIKNMKHLIIILAALASFNAAAMTNNPLVYDDAPQAANVLDGFVTAAPAKAAPLADSFKAHAEMRAASAKEIARLEASRRKHEAYVLKHGTAEQIQIMDLEDRISALENNQ